MVLLMISLHKAVSVLIGCVMPMATSGVPHSTPGSPGTLAAQSVPRSLRRGPSAQALHVILSWLSGITNETHYRGTILTAPLCRVTSGSSGSAITVQQGSSTAGLLQPIAELPETRVAVPSVLGRQLASATLEARYPDTAAEWDRSKNKGRPSDYPASSSCLAWWSSCQRRTWQQTINSRAYAVHQRTARLQRSQQRQTPGAGSQAVC